MSDLELQLYEALHFLSLAFAARVKETKTKLLHPREHDMWDHTRRALAAYEAARPDKACGTADKQANAPDQRRA